MNSSNNIKITTILLTTFFCTFSSFSWSTNEFISEDLIQSTKSTSTLQKISSDGNDFISLYNPTSDKKLYFVMSRLTDENFELWNNFAAGQAESCLRIWKEVAPNGFDSLSKETKRFLRVINVTRPGPYSIKAGLCAFEESLRIYEDYKSEVWIAYGLRDDNTYGDGKNIFKPVTSTDFPNIEMAVTILTNKESPFTVQIGIIRTVYCEEHMYKNNLKKTPSLSILLSTFAAKAIRQYDPNKIWMTTRPTFEMADIFEQHLSKESYHKGDSVEKYIQTSSDGLTVYDNEGKNAFFAPTSEIVTQSNWKWYFSHFYMNQPLEQHIFDLNLLASKFNPKIWSQSRKNE